MKLYLYKLLIIVFIFPPLLKAQGRKDSLDVSPIAQQFIKTNFLNHSFMQGQEFGEVSLQYQQSKGDFKRSNEAYSRKVVNFYAYGLNTVGKTTISGDFLFDKQFEDSLANILNNNLDSWSPMHYYAGKAGTYERQNYRSNLTLSYRLSKQIRPFLNVYYHKHWTTGSVDPRLESNKFILKYNPGLAYEQGNITASAKLLLGKSQESQDLEYKNSTYKQSLLFPERIHYLNLGYGYISIKDTSALRKFTDYRGGEIALSYRKQQHSFFLEGSYEASAEQVTHDFRSRKQYNIRAKYHENTVKAAFSWIYQGDNNAQYLQLQLTNTSGKDGNILFSKDLSVKNYQVDVSDIALDYRWSSQPKRPWQYDLGLQGQLFSLTRKDYASYTAVDNSYLQLQPSAALRYTSASSDQFHFSIAPLYRKALTNNLSLSENSINNFTRNVVIPDYAYYNSDLYGGTLKAEFFTKRISKNYLISLQYKLDWISPQSKKAATIYQLEAPNFHSRSQQALTLNLFL